jgi:glucose-1-phosphate cytidylyltransferase
VVILCGGLGTRLREETEVRPKPMVEIGGRPVLWHIMKTYAHYGFKDFILCLGYKGEVIRQYFYNYQVLNNDFTVDLGKESVEIHGGDSVDWRVTLVDTGINAATGARVKRVESFVDTDLFMVTYGDGVTDLDINKLKEFHISNGRIGTVTGVSPPSRYGELVIHEREVRSFREKPDVSNSQINGGYFVFNRRFFDYLDDDDSCVLEREPLERLSGDGQLMVYSHRKFWQCMDTSRDMEYLRSLWDEGSPPWKVWR